MPMRKDDLKYNLSFERINLKAQVDMVLGPLDGTLEIESLFLLHGSIP